jgi:hypothetical protein
MMTRKITIMALIAGIVLGAAATEGFNVYRRSHDSRIFQESHDSRIFQERLSCKAVADAYVKEENSTDPELVNWTLDKVDYSPARNSCVAELESVYARARFMTENVQDLLSGETLFSAKCTDDCEALKFTLVNSAFDYVINNPSIPLEVKKAWALALSKNPPQSAPPSGVQIDPTTGERIGSKYPPKSAAPSSR